MFLQVSQGVAEMDELRKRLEVAETELKLVLEGSRGRQEAEELTEGGADGQSTRTHQRLGRKNRRGDESYFSTLLCFAYCKTDAVLLLT